MRRVGAVITLVSALGGPVLAQKSIMPSPAARLGIHPYPRREQSPAQLRADEQRCFAAAGGSTGIDPFAPMEDEKLEIQAQRTELFKKTYAACLVESGYEVKR